MKSIDERMVRRIGGLSGIFGPLYFFCVLLVLGMLHPGYSHLRDYMSELGAEQAPYLWWMNVFGFMALGIFICVFALGLYVDVRKQNKWNLGVGAIAVSGFSLVGVAIFRCDPGCINTSIIGLIHGYFAFFALFSLICAPLFLYPWLKQSDYWRSWSKISLLFFGLSLVCGLMYQLLSFGGYTGLMQRIAFGIPFVWVMMMGWQLMQISR